MSADLFVLIKNDFDDIKDLAKARWYGYKVIGNLERQLGKDSIEEFVCSTDEYYLDVILGDEVATDVSTDWACVKCTTKFIKRKERF